MFQNILSRVWKPVGGLSVDSIVLLSHTGLISYVSLDFDCMKCLLLHVDVFLDEERKLGWNVFEGFVLCLKWLIMFSLHHRCQN